MNISSRTPEGWPGRCPTCGRALKVEPSPATRDATCPYCGSLVWLSRPGRANRPAARTLRLLIVLVAVGLMVGVSRSAGSVGLHGPELVALGVVALLLFGRRLPEFGRWLALPFRVV
ncbi:MAG: hypothetical protein J2P46_07630 [Zavarzinella sp.]|nr:hypothetical protein [Zavarzinella sp.]